MTCLFSYPCGIPSLTLTAELYPSSAGDADPVATLALVANTHRLGYYSASTPLLGIHYVRVLNGTGILDVGWVNLNGAEAIFDESHGILTSDDPFLNSVPGGYSAGQAGYVLGNIIPSLSRYAQFTGVVPASGPDMDLIYGDDYYNADLRGWPFVVNGTFASWVGATVALHLTINGVTQIVATASFTTTGSPRTITVDIPKAVSIALGIGEGTYSVVVTLATSAHIATVVKSGILTITP